MAKCAKCKKEVGCDCNLDSKNLCKSCRDKEEREAKSKAAVNRLINKYDNK